MNLITSIQWIVLLANFLSTSGTTTDCPRHCICTFETIICKRVDMRTVPKFGMENSIVTVDLSGNYIEEVTDDDFLNMESIKYLHLFGNRIIDVHEKSFYHLKELNYLDLSDNMIEDISNDLIINNKQLVALELSDNLFTVPPMLKSTSLNKINLSFNKIAIFTEKHLLGLPNLHELQLGSNSLTTLDANIFLNAPNLMSVDLQMNMWECNCETIAMISALVIRNLTAENPLFCLKDGQYKDVAGNAKYCDTSSLLNSTDLSEGMVFVDTKNMRTIGDTDSYNEEYKPLITLPQLIVIVINILLFVILSVSIGVIVKKLKRPRRLRNELTPDKKFENLNYINI